MDLYTYVPALIAFGGVVIGGTITGITNFIITKKSTQLRLVEKIFDKRIQAHEEVLKIPQALNTMINTYQVDDFNNIISYPFILNSLADYEIFKNVIYESTIKNMHWLDIELIRELNYLQDYIATLDLNIKELPESQYIKIGLIIKQDFIGLSMALNKQIEKFFEINIYSVNANPSKGHHKYPLQETMGRLNSTLLSKNKDFFATI